MECFYPVLKDGGKRVLIHHFFVIMDSSSTALTVMTNTASDLKRIVPTGNEEESETKRICDISKEEIPCSTELQKDIPEKKTWSSFVKPMKQIELQPLNNETEEKTNEIEEIEEIFTVNESTDNPVKTEKTPSDSITKESKALQVNPTPSLTIEQQMERVLESMGKDILHQEFKPPTPINPNPSNRSPNSITHFVFVYIPHRGCSV